MKFLADKDGGYVNALYVRRFDVKGKQIIMSVDGGLRLIFDRDFDTDEEAQNYLEELIDELEGDNNDE